MTAFWRFAVLMLRQRRTLTVAAVAAVLSAVCFGAGIATIPIVLNAMLGGDPGNQKTLRQFAVELDARIGGRIPDAWIEVLPVEPFRGVVAVLIVVIVLTLIGATAKYFHTLAAMTLAIRTIANLRKRAFDRVVHFPLKTIIAQGATDSISRILRDTGQLGRGFMAITSKAVGEILKGLTALGVALWYDWRMTLIALIGAPLLAGAIGIFSNRIKKASRRALIQASAMLGAVTESLQGIRVVKVHTAERQEVGKFNRTNRGLLREEMTMRRIQALSSPVVEGLTVIGVALIGGVAAWYIIEGGADRDFALTALFVLGIAGASVRPLMQLSSDIHESAAAAERLAALLDQPGEEAPRHRGIEASRHRGIEASAPQAELTPSPRHAESIEFRSVWFTYPNATRPALRGINLTIRHGEIVAFVGPNGSGKTTLLSLIPRLFDPDEGAVLIDAVDLAGVSLRSIRRQIAVVTQETVIFNDTLARNIAYGNGEVSAARIEAAARAALADEFIRAKPQGYDTVVGEQGATLSGGQRQRLAIARAILRDPRILILDEATSMIDADSESQINAVLKSFCRDRTSLIIAHRLSTVIHADRIVVLDEGRIVDVGRHDDLILRCGLYQQLCRTQLVG